MKIGETYNKLTVVKKLNECSGTNRLWLCRCECGNLVKSTAYKISSGHTKSCGCLVKETAAANFQKEIGKTYQMLRILKDSGKRTKGGQRIVTCRCACGQETDVVFSKLTGGYTHSCGCYARKIRQATLKNRTKEDIQRGIQKQRDQKQLIEGTRVLNINKPNQLLKNNTSGRKGVTFDKSRQKWLAQIEFQGKHHFLGRYSQFEDAVKAREEAEEKYFQPILDQYDK
ncbi:AP2 domain-containing protein [Listeria fleischmannii]|uniref:AP2 domain-containing protein n=1 Tax=Listeria fleischmannii TaxID=1069827 RepID=UPI00162A5621|nr:AP2 domain-containing protein [Listeria fleischmannii]MBC1419896.1 AP2 domain-containing protein [Listeria fleischmannii]